MKTKIFNFENCKKCKKFIMDFFEFGEKMKVFSFFDKFKISLDVYRYSHMVSTYFLGIYLSSLFFDNRDKKTESYRDFLWMWFIVCLYHDVGYVFENNTDKFKSITNFKELIENKDFNFKYLFYDDLRTTIYTKNLIEKYFDFRITEKQNPVTGELEEGKIEHGIVGGLLLYNNLKKNYFHIKDLANSNDNAFIFKGKNFDACHLGIFSNLADIITAHNIWIINEDDSLVKKSDIALYKKYELDELINIKHPAPDNVYTKLFYLLCICDTIEPIKRFNKNEKQILSKIDISIHNKEITISVLDDKLDCKKYFKNILELKYWLTISSVVVNNLKITIK